MSYAVTPLKTCLVMDPVSNINKERCYGIYEGGQESVWKPADTQSVTNSQISFSANPPNPGVIVNRKIYIKVDAIIDFSGDSGDPARGLLQTNFDAPRFMPLTSCMENASIRINNESVPVVPNRTIHAFTRYQTDVQTKNGPYSLAPSMQDTFQRYDNGGATVNNKNPLAWYGDNATETPRGGFPYEVISNTQFAAQVRLTTCEPVFISPMLWGKGNQQGFIGVQTIDAVFQLSKLSRMWCHSTASAVASFDEPTVTIQENPQLLFNYITPKDIQKIPSSVTYQYSAVDQWDTKASALAPGASTTVTTNNIQLSSIPDLMYIYVKRDKNEETFETTDTFMAIEDISINFANKPGILSSATPQDLYRISVSNGCNMSWTEWSGGPVDFSTGGVEIEKFGTVGSVLCLKFGKDIGLPNLLASGMNGTFNLSIKLRFRNANLVDTITPRVWVAAVSEGTFTILNQRSISNIGVISKENVLQAESAGVTADYEDVKTKNGGNFLTSIDGDIYKYVHGRKSAGILLGGCQGGKMIGGKRMKRKDLRSRLMY